MYVRFLVFLLLIACSLSACSVFQEVPARSLPIAPVSDGDSVSELQKTPYLYYLSFADKTLPPLYVTLLEECEITESLTERATTRQLFIGLEDLTIKEQSRVQVGSDTLVRSLAHARMEDIPLTVISYSLRKKDCVRDYVSWIPDQPIESIDQDILEELYFKLEQFLNASSSGAWRS